MDARQADELAKLANELRGPLAAIRHATVASQLPGASEEQVRWTLEVSARQVDQMSRVLDAMMALLQGQRVEPSPPVVEPAAAGEVAKAETALRILVADDNRDNADACATLLAMIGHDVRTAYSGLEAVAVADVFRPQIVMLDIAMPGATGHEVARRIRGRSWGSAAVLIAVTGRSQDEDRRQAEEAGFDHFLVKPVDLQRLEPLLKLRG